MSLNRNLKKFFQGSFNVIIYDNSPYSNSKELDDNLTFDFYYHFNGQNDGLAKAYNFALNYDNYEWLMLLDQDTDLQVDYFTKLSRAIKQSIYISEIAAIVPKIIVNDLLLSPKNVGSFGYLRNIKEHNLDVITNEEIMAINSGLVLNKNFIKKIGGFNEKFSLDFLDHWLFKKLYEYNQLSMILNVYLKHNLSLSNLNNIAIERYENILESERMFFEDFNSKINYYFYKCKLIIRVVKLFKNRHFLKAKMNFCNLFKKRP